MDELLTAVAIYRSGYDFKSNDLEGALRLSLGRDTEAALEVRTMVLARPEALSDAGLRALILRHSQAMTVLDLARVAEVLAHHLAEADGEDLCELLATLPLREVEQVCRNLEDDKLAEKAFATLAETAAAAQKAGHANLAELLLRTLLGCGSADARTAAEPVLPAFAPISTPATVDAILRAMMRRTLGAWPKWLSPLDPRAIANGDNRQTLAAVVPALWRRRFKPSADQKAATAEEFEAVEEALVQLSPGDLNMPVETASELLTSVAPIEVTTQAELDAREEQIAALWSLADRHVFSMSAVGSAVLADLETTLAAAVPPDMAPAVATYVVGEASRALPEAGEIGEFGVAVASSSWVDESSRLLLRARVAVAESRLGLDISDNLNGEDITALKEHATPDSFAALSDWLRSFGATPEVVINLFDSENTSRTTIDTALQRAVREVADRWSPDEKAVLFERLAPPYHRGEAGSALLRLCHSQEADSARVVVVLLKLFEQSGNNDGRERVLQLWAIARPATATAQRTLADKIYIPLLSRGKDAVRLALAHFDLVQHMTGNVRDRVRQALQEATSGDSELGKRADRRMREAGWIKKKKPWWRIA